MSGWIADELRKWVNDANLYAHQIKDLRAIADRIDEEHERAVEEAVNKRASCIVRDYTDDDLAAMGLVRLPTGVDGEYIHIGDVVSQYRGGKPIEHVSCILYYDEGVWIETDRGTVKADGVFHYKPTPAEIIRAALKNGAINSEGEVRISCDDAQMLRDLADELEGAGE